MFIHSFIHSCVFETKIHAADWAIVLSVRPTPLLLPWSLSGLHSLFYASQHWQCLFRIGGFYLTDEMYNYNTYSTGLINTCGFFFYLWRNEYVMFSVRSACHGTNHNVGIFLDTLNVMNVKLCMMVILFEHYPFIPFSNALTVLQGHITKAASDGWNCGLYFLAFSYGSDQVQTLHDC